MSVKDVAINLLKMITVAVLYAMVVYNEGAFATISFYCVGVILLMKDTTAGNAMLLGGIAGLIGQVVRGDTSLVLVSFINVALISYINCLLSSSKLEAPYRVMIVCAINMAICLISASIIYGTEMILAIVKFKVIELVLALFITDLLLIIIAKLGNR